MGGFSSEYWYIFIFIFVCFQESRGREDLVYRIGIRKAETEEDASLLLRHLSRV